MSLGRKDGPKLLAKAKCAPAEVAGLAVDAAGIIAGMNIDAAHFVPRLEVCPGFKPPQAPEVLQGIALPAMVNQMLTGWKLVMAISSEAVSSHQYWL